MISISNNGIITIGRGDYAEIPLFINQGNQMYPIRYSLIKDPSAIVTFAIMTAQQEIDNALIKKYFSVDSPHTNQKDLIIVLNPNDTLRLTPGKYFYSVKVEFDQHGHRCAKTIIPKRLFIVKE